MPNSVTNVWSATSKQKVDLEGEEILAVGWLHNGSWVRLFPYQQQETKCLHFLTFFANPDCLPHR